MDPHTFIMNLLTTLASNFCFAILNNPSEPDAWLDLDHMNTLSTIMEIADITTQ